MSAFINLAILRNPANWLTLGAMILLTFAAFYVVSSKIFHTTEATASNLQPET